MSDIAYERCEITNRDVGYEFNPTRYRSNLAKNQQMYGIWTSHSNNENAKEYNQWGQQNLYSKKPKYFTTPVNFVAGGVQQYGKKKDKKEDNSINDKDENDDSNNLPNESQSPKSDEEAYRELPPFSQQSKSAATGIGQWESYTKGIGAKLLLQMGYEPGKGLGKSLQGIATPVQAFARKGRGAIGAYGPEKLAKVIQPGELGEERSKKLLNYSEKNQKHFYRNVEEIIEKDGKKDSLFFDSGSSKLGNVTVNYSSTVPEKRVQSGYYAIGQSIYMAYTFQPSFQWIFVKLVFLVFVV